ncbi:protein flp [Plakobranchus ocellatus]|uniref:Protein flp n=1 Tax=Plakobranchus ocellatus TaxID=259542 RepID=A0AAV4BDM0_9GAST|nr:protein flp [Plakobranchus ocellatus]
MPLRDLLLMEFDLEINALWAEQTLREALLYSATSTPSTAGQLTSTASAVDMSTTVGLPKETTREEIIRRVAQFMPDTPEFKSTGHYSNLMYTIAGHLAEKMSGMTWEQLIKTHVLEKQDMGDPHFGPVQMEHGDIALPFHLSEEFGPIKQNRSLFDLHPFEPVGSIMVSADDVTKWLRHLLHNLYMKGNDSGINMLIEDAFVRVLTPPDQQHGSFERLQHESEATLGYGMGWQVSQYKGRRRYKYTGNLYAYTSHIWLFPETRTAVFLALNSHSDPTRDSSEHQLEAVLSSSLAMRAILYQITDVAHREQPWIELSDFCQTAPEKDYDPDLEPVYVNDEGMQPLNMVGIDYRLPVEAYIGSYGNGLVGDLVIAASEDGLLTVTLGRNLKGELRPKEGAPRKLMLKVVGWLEKTYEWIEDKTLEFLPISVAASSGGEKFEVVRLYLSTSLYYDFERGKMFDTMLVEAEEEEVRKQEEEIRRQKEEEERIVREEEERKMKEEAARKAKEEEEKRKREEEEKKAMAEAVAREKAEEERKAKEEAARKAEAEKKAMMEAVAREKAEEERRAREEEERKAEAQTAALEERQSGGMTDAYSSVNLNRDDSVNRHQSHQPYSGSEGGAEVEQHPPGKGGRSEPDDRHDKSRSTDVHDKDGVCSGPSATPGVLLLALSVAFLHRLFHNC